jgi:hypothetical protein
MYPQKTGNKYRMFGFRAGMWLFYLQLKKDVR